MWQQESEEVRVNFKAQAEKLKQEHLQLYPDYTYRPRKPAERKKRMTKKKAAALVKASAAANTAKNLQNVRQYASFSEPSGHLDTEVKNGAPCRRLTLPLPPDVTPEMIGQLTHVGLCPEEEDIAGTLGFDLGPSAAYEAANANDLAFFPEIDETQPDFKALIKEASEAYASGYYDVALHRHDYYDAEYQLQEYVDLGINDDSTLSKLDRYAIR